MKVGIGRPPPERSALHTWPSDAHAARRGPRRAHVLDVRNPSMVLRRTFGPAFRSHWRGERPTDPSRRAPPPRSTRRWPCASVAKTPKPVAQAQAAKPTGGPDQDARNKSAAADTVSVAQGDTAFHLPHSPIPRADGTEWLHTTPVTSHVAPQKQAVDRQNRSVPGDRRDETRSCMVAAPGARRPTSPRRFDHQPQPAPRPAWRAIKKRFTPTTPLRTTLGRRPGPRRAGRRRRARRSEPATPRPRPTPKQRR